MIVAITNICSSKQYQEVSQAKHAGFTLVEVLLSIAIVSIVFGTIYRTFDTFSRSYTKENVKAGIQQKARIGIELMARDIRLGGSDILSPLPAGCDPATAALRSVPEPPDGIERAWQLEGRGFAIPVCDYPSAGNTWDASSRFAVWIETP